MNKTNQNNYLVFLNQIKERIRNAQYDALKVVNKELISMYWDIGKMIVERQKKHNWGKSVVENIASDLQKEFPGVKGFSSSNLWRMRIFYEHYRKNEKLAPMVREIGWSHNIAITEKCKDNLEQEFYIRMTRKYGWSKNVLIHQIENKSYEKTLLNQTNFNKTITPEIKKQAKLAVKDEYSFDFLELGEEHSEKQLEKAILSRMDRFLREMGGLFAFVGSQFRLEVEDKEYFIDILLYHRHLRSLVALELKVGEFIPEYVGKMQFYLAVLDEKVRAKSENPSIGIIICKTKYKMVVEYALRQSEKPIGVAAYKVSAVLPKDLRKELPAPEKIAMLLNNIEK